MSFVIPPSIQTEIDRLVGDTNLPRPPYPTLNLREKSSVNEKLKEVQRYISALQYNYTPFNFFPKRKDRGMRYVCSIAKRIMEECLPIQCVEAVFLAIYLTAGLNDVTIIKIP